MRPVMFSVRFATRLLPVGGGAGPHRVFVCQDETSRWVPAIRVVPARSRRTSPNYQSCGPDAWIRHLIEGR